MRATKVAKTSYLVYLRLTVAHMEALGTGTHTLGQRQLLNPVAAKTELRKHRTA